ncbi:hypothetical protein [Sulfitobacter sp. JB4-11]|uniref:hypothetical protein n=1 Tax=Sulfitobacter rhodophyticola TaxID=3238304 RepID=UPI00351720A9
MKGKTAVIVFSITGHSHRAASQLTEMLDATLIPLHAPKYTSGAFGYVRAAIDSLLQRCPLGPQSFSSLAEFDRVILCGPVWTSYPAAPLRAVLRGNFCLPASVSLFLTTGGRSPATKVFDVAARDLDRPLVACASLPNDVQGTGYKAQIYDRFVADLRTGESRMNKSAPAASDTFKASSG